MIIALITSTLTELFSNTHRSPWSNKYKPFIEDGFVPSDRLRSMEIEFNELFDAYRELYFEGMQHCTDDDN